MIRFKIFILFAIYCIANKFCYAQDNYADSLRKELVAYQKEDTNRIKSLISYGYYIMFSNIDSGYIYARKSIELAKKIKWDKGLANGMLALSRAYVFYSRYDSSVATAMNALKISENIHDDKTIASAHWILAESYRLMQVYDRAEYHGLKSLELAKSAKNDSLTLYSFLNLYSIYLQQKKWHEAEKYYPPAMKIALKLKDELGIALLFELKGATEFDKKNFTGALRYYREAILSYKKQNVYRQIAYVQAELSKIFVELKNKDSAAFYANAALITSKEHDLKKELIDSYNALFNAAYEFGDYQKAIEYRLVFDSLNSELNSQQMAQNMERSRLEFEQQKKDIIAKAEQERRENDAKRIRNFQFVAFGTVLLIAVFLFIYSRQKQKAKAKIEKAYTELKTTQAQLIQSEKMASLGELTAGIAHEIQNPLNFVNNFSEVNKELIEELKGERSKAEGERNSVVEDEILGDIEQNLEKINHHGKRADAIVKGMLQHSRISTGQKEPTDINALADEYLRLSYHGMRAKDKSFNAEIKADFDGNVGLINIVTQDIARVLLNIFNNAFYAVNEQRQKSDEAFKPLVTVSTKKENGKLILKVADNGAGIPQKILDKIFQPFFTTKPTGQGTGLGLSLSYDIVKTHGGEIKVGTKEDEGSEFIIQLPV